MDEETCEELSKDLKSLSEDGIDVKGVHWSTKHDEAAIPENLTPRLRHIGDNFTWTLNLILRASSSHLSSLTRCLNLARSG
jgi:hypothetical protein